MFDREFYPLSELAKRWSCEVSDLLHLGIQGKAQICANIYGMATDVHSTRAEEEDDLNFDAQELTTLNMPPGIFEIKSNDIRLIDMPNGLPFELEEAIRFDDGWRFVDFPYPVTIGLDHLVMLHEEVERLERERVKATTPKLLPTDNSLLATIAALIAAWPGGNLPSGKDLEKAAASVGVSVTDDTIRKALRAAKEITKIL